MLKNDTFNGYVSLTWGWCSVVKYKYLQLIFWFVFAKLKLVTLWYWVEPMLVKLLLNICVVLSNASCNVFPI